MVMPKLPSDLSPALRHLEAAYPSEGCGVIVQLADGDFRIHPMRNVYDELHAKDPARYPRTSRTAYQLDAREQLALWEATEQAGGRICAVFHSHADVGAYFSAEDRELAAPGGEPLLPDVAYLVVAVDEGRATAIRCFWWSDRQLLEASLPLPAA